MYVRPNTPPHQLRYNYPVTVDVASSSSLLCFALSRKDTEAAMTALFLDYVCFVVCGINTGEQCADLECLHNCDTGGNSDLFFIYFFEYINCAFHIVPKETGLKEQL